MQLQATDYATQSVLYFWQPVGLVMCIVNYKTWVSNKLDNWGRGR